MRLSASGEIATKGMLYNIRPRFSPADIGWRLVRLSQVGTTKAAIGSIVRAKPVESPDGVIARAALEHGTCPP